MRRAALDASALLAIMLGEAGGERTRPHLPGGCLSAVNADEVLTRLARSCGSLAESRRRLDLFNLDVVPFDADQAVVSASLRPATDPRGLSLGDRACLSLALTRGLVAVTADRPWAELDLGVEVEVIR